MTDDRLLLDLALAEVRRLRPLVAEAAQAAVQLRMTASRLAARAPLEARALEERADRIGRLIASTT